MQQCRLLEQGIGTNYLQLCLEDPLTASSIVCEAKRDILSWDWASTLLALKTHPSLTVVVATDEIASTWNRLWDEALEYGVRGTRLMQGLFAALDQFSVAEPALTVKTSSPHPILSTSSQSILSHTTWTQLRFGWKTKTTRTNINWLKKLHL